ncbi:Glycosyltransferase family 10 (fucosyltransferase) [Seminavis robusta]|uniref:Fucosyltransferase n=1 Tax=Seminavis robusta TaxID=568900 RepID=A0A9N8ESM1_9STRA|nr:Glycosyltransferase family 10 (fucosyltransferase) [Seminavis robusta]|eukprot:Sro1527_g279860.1 Glycosyltransferase family 10 (fucosyltransferase) (388) ;mRNA; r:5579-6742
MKKIHLCFLFLVVVVPLYQSQKGLVPPGVQEVATSGNNATASGGLFFCGWIQWQIAQEIFPDYAVNVMEGYDEDHRKELVAIELHKGQENARVPTENDILVVGMFGPCSAPMEAFPGKVLFVNGENRRKDMTQKLNQGQSSNRAFQIGMVRDNPEGGKLKVYFMAMALLSLPPTMWRQHGRFLQHLTQPKPTNTQKYPGVIYMHGNCKPYRERAIRQISHILPIYHSATKCNGTTLGQPTTTEDYNPNNFSPVQDPPTATTTGMTFWMFNHNLFHDYQFCLCMENMHRPLYITEKILTGFLAGCIPIYYGTTEIFRIFNPKAFVYYDIDNAQPALDQLAYLIHNKTAYDEMLYQQPILLHGQETIDEYFALWDGGALQRKLRDMMGL